MRRCLDSQEMRNILSGESQSLLDISGGGDDSDEDKTFILKKVCSDCPCRPRRPKRTILFEGKN